MKVDGVQRIVGGQLANDNQFPYQVAIIRTFGRDNLQDFWCGGTLIHPEWVSLRNFITLGTFIVRSYNQIGANCCSLFQRR